MDTQLEPIKEDIKELKDSVSTIRENHLAHIQESMSTMQVDIAKVSTDVAWLVKYHWVLTTAILGSMGGLIMIIFKIYG